MTVSKKKTRNLTLETIPLEAQNLSRALGGGEVILLCGPLGAGKTTFTKALAKNLKYKGIVTSPTFTLVQTYTPVKLQKNKSGRIYHLDLYRLGHVKDLEALEVEEFIAEPNSVTLIEWGDKFPKYFDKFHPYVYQFTNPKTHKKPL